MASDVVPASSAWATTAMMPATGEEINALWGDQSADNTGWLFHTNYACVAYRSEVDAWSTDEGTQYGNVFYYRGAANGQCFFLRR